MREFILIINNDTIEKYNKYYFSKYPRRKKCPIKSPTHPSINEWMIMKRMMMNDLKGKWKEFIIWFVENSDLKDTRIDICEMTFISYFKTKIRKDTDNTVPKFILDGLVDSKLLIDDDSLHLTSLTLKCGYDKLNPRTEIHIFVLE